MPIHTQMLQNIHALLDVNRVSKVMTERVAHFSKLFNLQTEDSAQFLEGHKVPDRKLLKAIADTFEVDLFWLIGSR